MTTKLYELTDAYARILALAEGAEDGEWMEALAGLQGAIEEKAENTAKAIRILEADAETFKAEAQRMMAHAQTRQKRVQSLKDYLQANLEAVGLEKIKAGLFTVALQASPPSCRIIDEVAIPTEYQRVIPARIEVDARAIIAHWKDTGEGVPGAEVIQSRHLRIR